MDNNAKKMFTTTIGNIRDILRKVGITDMDCIMHCIAFMSLRRTTTEICQSLGIPDKYAFDSFAENLDDEELRNKFWLPDPKSDCFVSYLRKQMGFKSFKFRPEIGNLSFRQIFKVLEELDTETLENSCDIVGDIYEMHLKTGSKTSRDLGQFFTNRLVIKFMIDLVKPQLKKDGIETVVDPTMGTGGFLSMVIDYYNKLGKINWKKNKDRIFGFDLDARVRDFASLNLFLETGYKFPHLLTRDTLGNDICVNEKPISCDIILANEPMGLKGLKFIDFCDRIKELKIQGTKAEPAFMQLFMQSLNKNGRCAVIVPDGMLFQTSKQHTETRKRLIENFDVREIVKMTDKNFFMNTGVSVSIIYFANVDEKERNESIIFSEISLNKDQTEIEYKKIRDVSYEEIREKEYILNPSIYIEEKTGKNEGIEYKKLGEICTFLPKSKRNASEGGSEGKYNFYTSSPTIKYCDFADYKEECIIIGTGGISNVNYGKNFSCSNHTTVIKSCDEENILSKYIYYFLLQNLHILQNQFTGTTIKNLSIIAIKMTEIPVPSITIQKEIVERLDILYEANLNCAKLIEQNRKKFEWYMEIQDKKYGRKMKLREICKFKRGKQLSRKNMLQGSYPVIGGGQQPSGYNDKYNMEKNTILCSSSGAYAGYISMYQNKVWASDCFAIIPLEFIDNKYLYYYLKSIQLAIYKYQTGTAQPHIYSKNIEFLEIPIPELSEQQKITQYCDSIFTLISQLELQKTQNEALAKEILETYLLQPSVSEEYAKIIFEDE